MKNAAKYRRQTLALPAEQAFQQPAPLPHKGRLRELRVARKPQPFALQPEQSSEDRLLPLIRAEAIKINRQQHRNAADTPPATANRVQLPGLLITTVTTQTIRHTASRLQREVQPKVRRAHQPEALTGREQLTIQVRAKVYKAPAHIRHQHAAVAEVVTARQVEAVIAVIVRQVVAVAAAATVHQTEAVAVAAHRAAVHEVAVVAADNAQPPECWMKRCLI